MKCPVCDYENSDNAKFCQECGSKIEPQLKACTNKECRDFGKRIFPPPVHFCMMCGYILLPEDKYCIRCGVKRLEEEQIEVSFSEEVFFFEEVSFSEADGYINGHEYVDLGLPSGLKWATCNVGADSPEDYGGYFAWGETYTKDEYKEENCDLCDVEMEDVGGDPEYDAATANWGGSWRMPKKEEFEELEEVCVWKWCFNKGMRVTGPNGNSIFFPAAGKRSGSSLYDAGIDGSYWSSSPSGSYSDYTCSQLFCSIGHFGCNGGRSYGRTIRPVSE